MASFSLNRSIFKESGNLRPCWILALHRDFGDFAIKVIPQSTIPEVPKKNSFHDDCVFDD